MQILSKDQIKGAADRKTEDVAVPEWGEGVGVRIRTLTVAEHRSFTSNLGDKDKDDDATLCAQLMVAACVDESGTPIFALGDVSWLLEKSSSAVKRIGRAIMALNGLNKGAVEESRKNS